MEPQDKPAVSTQKSMLTVPVAILIAGALIAGAVIWTNSSNKGGVVSNGTPTERKLTVKPVSENDYIVGNPNASVTLIEFSDLECPFCKSFHVTMGQLMESHGKSGDLAWVYRHFPLKDLHPKAVKESEAVECVRELAGKEKALEYINAIFKITPSNNKLELSLLGDTAVKMGVSLAQFNTCLDSGKYTQLIDDSIKDAMSAGGRGTPYSVILLKSPLSKDRETRVRNLFTNLSPGANDLLLVDPDRKILGVSGALPLSFMQGLMSALLE
jgi:protein-disulfide isomerase